MEVDFVNPKTDSVFQTNIYLDLFGIKCKKFVYGRQNYNYVIEKGEMCILSTCMKNICITEAFSAYIFNTFTGVNRVTFKNIFVPKLSARNALCKKSLDDNILDLAVFDNIEDYQSHLGKKTRQHLKNYRRRFHDLCEAENNAFELKVLIPQKESEEFANYCGRIYDLNSERCLSKGFSSGTDKRWIDVCARCGGAICYVLNNSVVAGTMFSLYNNNLYLHVIAHDNMYSSYNVGNLVLLDTIEYALEHRISEFHFLWGECDYKIRFGAEKYDLLDVTVYKSFPKYVISKLILVIKELKQSIIKLVLKALEKLGVYMLVKDILMRCFGRKVVDIIGRWMYRNSR